MKVTSRARHSGPSWSHAANIAAAVAPFMRNWTIPTPPSMSARASDSATPDAATLDPAAAPDTAATSGGTSTIPYSPANGFIACAGARAPR